MSPDEMARKLMAPKYQKVSKCVTGPEEGKWRVEFRHVEYLTDAEFEAIRRAK